MWHSKSTARSGSSPPSLATKLCLPGSASDNSTGSPRPSKKADRYSTMPASPSRPPGSEGFTLSMATTSCRVARTSSSLRSHFTVMRACPVPLPKPS